MMRSKVLIYEGPIKYYNFHSEIEVNYFQLYQDHLIRYLDVEQFQKNPEQARLTALVIPIT